MVSLELHFSYNSILNDINNINVFLRAIEALAELLKQESFTFPKIWEEITGNAWDKSEKILQIFSHTWPPKYIHLEGYDVFYPTLALE